MLYSLIITSSQVSKNDKVITKENDRFMVINGQIGDIFIKVTSLNIHKNIKFFDKINDVKWYIVNFKNVKPYYIEPISYDIIRLDPIFCQIVGVDDNII
jgi:hypothetical protein